MNVYSSQATATGGISLAGLAGGPAVVSVDPDQIQFQEDILFPGNLGEFRWR